MDKCCVAYVCNIANFLNMELFEHASYQKKQKRWRRLILSYFFMVIAPYKRDYVEVLVVAVV